MYLNIHELVLIQGNYMYSVHVLQKKIYDYPLCENNYDSGMDNNQIL